MRRAIAAALLASTMLAGLAAPAWAAGGGGHGGSEEGGGEISGRTMDAPYIAVPVVRDGRLRNYLFVSIRIDVSPGVDLWSTREKAHFVRDALVRVSHQSQLANPENDNELNEELALQVYRDAIVEVLGERAVGGVSILSYNSSIGR